MLCLNDVQVCHILYFFLHALEQYSKVLFSFYNMWHTCWTVGVLWYVTLHNITIWEIPFTTIGNISQFMNVKTMQAWFQTIQCAINYTFILIYLEIKSSWYCVLQSLFSESTVEKFNLTCTNRMMPWRFISPDMIETAAPKWCELPTKNNTIRQSHTFRTTQNPNSEPNKLILHALWKMTNLFLDPLR